MAVQNCIGGAARGASWVALHNGGGVGWGEVMNGGFGMVLDGSDTAARKAKNLLEWDVANGITRRCWAGKVVYQIISIFCISHCEQRALVCPKSHFHPITNRLYEHGLLRLGGNYY